MKYLWKTRDGIEINVDDMSESHAKNCLKMLMKRGQTFDVSAPEDLIQGVMDEWENEFWSDELRCGKGG